MSSAKSTQKKQFRKAKLFFLQQLTIHFKLYIKNYFGSDKIRVFSTVTKTSIKDFNDISEEKMEGDVYGVNLIFLSYDICSEQKFNEFVKDYGKW